MALSEHDRQVIGNIVKTALNRFFSRLLLYALVVGACAFVGLQLHERLDESTIWWSAAGILILWLTIASLIEFLQFRRERTSVYALHGKPTRIQWLRVYWHDLNDAAVPHFLVLAALVSLGAYSWHTGDLSVWWAQVAQWWSSSDTPVRLGTYTLEPVDYDPFAEEAPND